MVTKQTSEQAGGAGKRANGAGDEHASNKQNDHQTGMDKRTFVRCDFTSGLLVDIWVSVMIWWDFERPEIGSGHEEKKGGGERMRPSRHRFTKNMKRKALKKAGYACSICGSALNMISAEPHHIVPVAEGGETVPENLQIVCRACHIDLHNKPTMFKI